MPKAWRAVAAGMCVMLAAGALLWWRHFSPPSSTLLAEIGKTNDAKNAAAAEEQPSRGPIVPDTTKGLLSRPAPAVAARNIRRCGIGASLAPMGASPGIIERLSNGDITGVFSQLKAQAQAGDASAANQLDYIANFTCGFAGINGSQSDFQRSELLDSNSLPSTDSDWFHAVLKDRNAFNQQLLNVCQQSLDKGEIDTWVTAAAARGDPASHYSLWMFGGTNIGKLSDAHLRAAALGGYPWAQLSLGSRTLGESPWPISGGEASDHPGDLLRAAAQTIPAAEDTLARCEFTGCEYIPQDIPAAVADARLAAQQGSFGAMLAIGPQLQASQIDPDEVRAWQLIDAGLQLQGNEGININVRMIRSASAVLNSPTVTTRARALAEQNADDSVKSLSRATCICELSWFTAHGPHCGPRTGRSDLANQSIVCANGRSTVNDSAATTKLLLRSPTVSHASCGLPGSTNVPLMAVGATWPPK
jgi:hypothetical protein